MQRSGSLAVVLAAMIAYAVPARTHAQAGNSQPVISVTGQASVAVAPDHAQLRAGVTSQGASAREASESNAAAMTTVMAALKAAGIADRDIQTSRLSLQPISESDRAGPARITGFRASNQVTVTVHAIDKLSELIDRLVAAGANEIAGIEFRVASPSQALDEARTKAIADARRKAEIYAQAAGVTLGKAVSISEGGAIPLPVTRSDMTAALATIVAPGERTLTVTVNVSFEFMR
jgi:uncharacterized protein YggE